MGVPQKLVRAQLFVKLKNILFAHLKPNPQFEESIGKLKDQIKNVGYKDSRVLILKNFDGFYKNSGGINLATLHSSPFVRQLNRIMKK